MEYKNYIVKWELPDLSENKVNVEVLLDFDKVDENVGSFTVYLFDKRFGSIAPSSLLISIDDYVLETIDYTLNYRNDITEVVIFRNSKINIQKYSNLQLNYTINDSICKNIENEVKIQAIWASLFDKSVNFIEYDFIFDKNLLNLTEDKINLNYFPRTKASTRVSTDNSFGFYIPYNKLDINFGISTPNDVFFSINDDIFRKFLDFFNFISFSWLSS